MIIGKWNELELAGMMDFGALLADPEELKALGGDAKNAEKVLLPKKYVPAGAQIGDKIKVFIYRDSKDRIIANTTAPRLTVGEVAVLQVKQITGIGAFMDWGLEKDVLLPFKEQVGKVVEGYYYPVALYVDKSGRLAVSMWIDRYLKGDHDEKLRQRALLNMEADAATVHYIIQKKGGVLDYDDHADGEIIRRDFGLSKNAFKRAIGILMKHGKCQIDEGKIYTK